jgi:hypothetical protein
MRIIQLLCIGAFVISSCASPGNLGGGAEDTTPPTLLKSNIKETNFNEKEIILEFDEFIQLDNPTNNLKLMPSHTSIKAKIHKKKVIIEFDTALRANTTYSIVAENCFKDVNAGNVYNFTKTFSTGANLDSNYIDVELSYLKTEKNLFLALIENPVGDSLRNFNTDYIYQVKQSKYRFSGLKNKTYDLWLFTDADGNQKPDWYSSINFLLNISTDSLYSIKTLNWSKPFKIYKSTTDLKYTKLYYNHSEFYYDELRKMFPNSEKKLIYCNEDSSVFENFYYPNNLDTVPKIDVVNELIHQIEKTIEIIKNKNDKICLFKAPQAAQNKVAYEISKLVQKRLNLEEDSFFINIPRLDQNLLIKINSGKIKESKKLSYLNITSDSKKYPLFDIHIIKNDETILVVNETNYYEIYLEPGVYKIEIYERSFLHRFNPFEFKNRSALIYTKTLNLRASWEEILTLNLD